LDAPPGLILCGPYGAVTDMSDEARHLVGSLGTGEIPQVVAALRAKLAVGERAEAAVPARDGRWLAFHATTMVGQEVVIVEQVRSHRLADLIVRARGLTARERDVVELVARGRSTREIAQALFISEWTVQDHLKAVFAKFDVRSRQELVATMFFDHYGPRHAAEDTPSPYGWYLEASPDAS
jgi:DNA-binding CsgD family transcriptional regulator